MLVLLTACLLISSERHAERVAEVAGPTDSGSGPTPTTPEAPPILTNVAPAFGTDAGGTEVVLTGSAFGSSPDVFFGDEPALVREVLADGLVVETPASAEPGPVEVRVVTAAGEDALPASFTYWADASGRVGATGELAYFFLVGDFWEGSSSTDYGRSTLRFVEPVDYQFYRYWAPSLDTCSHWTNGLPDDGEYDPAVVSFDALDGEVAQTSSSAAITLGWNPAELRFTNYDLAPTEIVPGETYDLSVTGTVGVPEFELPDVFRFPSHFTVTSPAIDSDVQPEIAPDQSFEWTTEDEGDALLLQVGLLRADGKGFDEELHCALRDVGSFDLDASWWQDWAVDRQVHVLIGRYRAGDGLLPFNQGQIGVASQLWYYGVGRSVN